MLSVHFGYILGVLFGDGYINVNSIGMNAKDEDFILMFKACLEEYFKRECKIYRYSGLWRVELHSRHLAGMMKNSDYRIIRDQTNLCKGAFLRGFFDSEGSAYFFKKRGVRNRKVEICNTNLELMEFCKLLLNDLGIETLRIERRIRGERTIRGRTLKPFVFYRTTLRENKRNLENFKERVGFSIDRKQKNLDKMISTYAIEHTDWGDLKEDVISLKGDKTYYVPKGTIDCWLYTKRQTKTNK